MAPRDRSKGRDVNIYDAKDPSTVIGGLILTNGVTNANLYAMVEIFALFESDFELRAKDDTITERNGQPLQPGNYYIFAAAPFTINNEPWLLRTTSLCTGTRTQSFCDAVRTRDRRCVISGTIAVGAYFDNWQGFEAAHIFPLAYEGYWIQHNYGRWITIPSPKGDHINSLQNGILLRSDIHQLFDSYDLSINPDDNYKVVFFSPDGNGLAGKYLGQDFYSNAQKPNDHLLRWHFKQAVLANVRGVGEPQFEHDFPPSSDIIGDIFNGPKAAERMEFELFGRLAAQFKVHGVSST